MPKKTARTVAEFRAGVSQSPGNCMPGGVSSPVRAFKKPSAARRCSFARRTDATIEDVDGNKYIITSPANGPLIAGHANERVVAALSKSDRRGTSFGAPTEAESHLATNHHVRPAVRRDDPLRQQRHRGRNERNPPGAGRHRNAIWSSSASVAITATSTGCSSKPEAAR